MPVNFSKAISPRNQLLAVTFVVTVMAVVHPNTLYAFDFMGVDVKVHVQDYIVTADVNIRAKPKTKSKKLGKLKKTNVFRPLEKRQEYG